MQNNSPTGGYRKGVKAKKRWEEARIRLDKYPFTSSPVRDVPFLHAELQIRLTIHSVREKFFMIQHVVKGAQ